MWTIKFVPAVLLAMSVAIAAVAWVRVEEAKQATIQAGYVACAVACARSAPVDASSIPGALR